MYYGEVYAVCGELGGYISTVETCSICNCLGAFSTSIGVVVEVEAVIGERKKESVLKSMKDQKV